MTVTRVNGDVMIVLETPGDVEFVAKCIGTAAQKFRDFAQANIGVPESGLSAGFVAQAERAEELVADITGN